MSAKARIVGAFLLATTALLALPAAGQPPQGQTPAQATLPGAELLRVNPVLRELSQGAGSDSIIVLEGYVGATNETYVRLYPSLDLSMYLDIPKGGILRVTEDKARTDQRVQIFVRSTSDVRVTVALTVPASTLPISTSAQLGSSPQVSNAQSRLRHQQDDFGQDCYWDCVDGAVLVGPKYRWMVHPYCQRKCQISMPSGVFSQ